MNPDNSARVPKPRWLAAKLPGGPSYTAARNILDCAGIRTVCRESRCPNTAECFSRKAATVLILGPACTRSCRFCAVNRGPTHPLDPEEPLRTALAVSRLGLRYTVITSVTRDDLPDGGAKHFAETVRAVRAHIPGVRVEVLVPDFCGAEHSIRTVLDAAPDVFAHNLDTVRRLQPSVKPKSDYRRSLDVLRAAGRIAPGIPLKSGIMLGMGETLGETEETLGDLLAAGCRTITIGQYLSPSRTHHPVARFVPPEEFDRWRDTALTMGFTSVKSGPLVRSSYRAGE